MDTPSSFQTDNLIADDIDAYLEAHQHKSLLRFITCGSVDDGKSTLIGRLLYDSKMIFEDQLAALESDSKRHGTQGEEIDFALLVDGLAAEREQGITIDVAYRFFTTEKRKFIVADTPGHEQYTRNMVTGASTADCAVILIDCAQGRAAADPAAFLAGPPARHPPCGAGGEQRWIWSAMIQAIFDQILADLPRTPLCQRDRDYRLHRDPHLWLQGRQHHARAFGKTPRGIPARR